MAINGRRPLNAAMDIGADKVAFIRGSANEIAPIEGDSKDKNLESEAVGMPDEAPSIHSRMGGEADMPARRKYRSRSSRPSAQDRTEYTMSMENVLVPLTTRLSPNTAAALKRAGLEQKLYRRQPSTVQEIAEEAIKAWLLGEGYL